MSNRVLVHGLRLALSCTILVGSSACGPTPDSPPERLIFQESEPSAPAEPRVVQRFDAAAIQGSWTLIADDASLQPRDGDESGKGLKPLLRLSREASDKPIRLLHKGTFDLSSFDRIRLRISCSGGTLVFGSFLENGVVLAKTKAVSATHMAAIGVLDLPLPPSTTEAGIADTFALYIGKSPRAIRLASIEFVSTPAASLVPSAAGETSLAKLGAQARRAVGVTRDRPVQTVFRVPPEGVLGFGIGSPPSGRWRGDDPVLVLTLTPEGGRPQVTEYPLARGPEHPVWRDVRLPLDDLAGSSVLARFELRTAPGQEAACVVSEASTWSRRLPARPSLLLITTDTHRADHLGGALRPAGVDTPVLDALAARGVFFEDCFSTINYTNPSHMALMTGNHPRDVGILTNKQAIHETADTLAELLSEKGYRTYAALSARHLGDAISGLGQGFDRMTWPAGTQRRSERTLDIVEDWLDSDDERPLFLWLHVFDAHRPYEAPAYLLTRYYDGPADPYDEALPPLPEDIKLPPEMEGLRVLDYPLAQYKALVSHLDGQLARVLEHPRLQDAVVAVVGDHGEELGDHAVWFDHAELYPDTLHVPLLIAWPGGPEGQRESRPVSHLDLGRTLLDLVGLEDAVFPGTSLVGPAAGGQPGQPRYAISSHGSSGSMTLNGMHLILRLQGGHHLYDHHQVELYDLHEDPRCQRDLVDERPTEARAMRAQLVDWLGEAPSDSLAGPSVKDPQVLAALAQLGYTGTSNKQKGPLWQTDGCAWCQRFQ